MTSMRELDNYIPWPRMSASNTAYIRIEFPPLFSRKKKNSSWILLTTAIDCCLECCLRRTKRVVAVDTERNTPACCLGCCQSDDSRACSKKRAVNPKSILHQPTIGMSLGFSDRKGSRGIKPRSRWSRGSFPMKGIHLADTTKTSNVKEQG